MASSKPLAKRRKAADQQQQALFAVQHQQTLEKISKHFDKNPAKVSEVHRMLVSAPYSLGRLLLPCSRSGWLGFSSGPSSAASAAHFGQLLV